MRATRAAKVIGYDVTPGDARDVFGRLMMAADVDGDEVGVEIPGYRVDIEREVDLIEEVVRVQGYERVGSTLPPVRQVGGAPGPYAFRDRVRRSLVHAGLREVWSYPFASDDDLRLTGDRDAIRVTNPLQVDEGWLRTRLTPGLLKTIRRNASRHVRSASLFEIGTVFRLVDGAPQERTKAALAMTGVDEGSTGRRDVDFFDAKGAVEALMTDLGISWAAGDPIGGLFHPGRSAFVMVDGERVGVLGEVHPRVAEAVDVPGRIAVAELEVELLMRRAATSVSVEDVPRFPPIRRDLAFVVDEGVSHARVAGAIRDAGGDIVATCVLFDVHVGPPLPEGKKSLAFSVELRDPSRTLEREEADAAIERIRTRVRDDLGGELRSA